MQSAAGARAAFEDAPNVSVVEIPINDGWARDWGPSVSPPPTPTAALSWLSY
jgi:agmatine/peptidylarginine deiminase